MTGFFDRVGPAVAERQTDIDRILRLPRVEYSDAPLPELPEGELTLHPIQRAALRAVRDTGGGLLPIGVGHGKSWIAVLAATVLDVDAAIILAPSATIRQLAAEREKLAAAFPVKPAELISYERLSRADASAKLRETAERLGRCVLVLDEAHKVRRLQAARTKRVRRFVETTQCPVVAMSGTLTSKSLHDFAHLSRWALGDGSPLPLSYRRLVAWANALDVETADLDQQWLRSHDALRLVTWAAGSGTEINRVTARDALRVRINTAPGVVASKEGSIGASLLVRRISARTLATPAPVQLLLDQLADGTDPQGEPVADPASIARIARQLVSGYWYRWVWPDGEPDVDWLLARADWHRHLRDELSRRSREGYDSPLLVSHQLDADIDAGTPRREIHGAWLRWERENHKDPPPVETVWVSDYFVDAICDWQREHPHSLVWFDGRALEAKLRSRGLAVYGQAERSTFDPAELPDAACLSWRVFGTGLNLQRWQRQLVAVPPASGTAWEQLLGRCHRVGQLADEVEVDVFTHSATFARAWDNAKRDARYIQRVTGNAQKLLYATLTV